MMIHDDFKIGTIFRCGDGVWRCTDVGTRTIVAIRIDRVRVGSTDPAKDGMTLGYLEASAQGWFKGPPYGVAELSFDEEDLFSCEPATVWDASAPRQAET